MYSFSQIAKQTKTSTSRAYRYVIQIMAQRLGLGSSQVNEKRKQLGFEAERDTCRRGENPHHDRSGLLCGGHRL